MTYTRPVPRSVSSTPATPMSAPHRCRPRSTRTTTDVSSSTPPSSTASSSSTGSTTSGCSPGSHPRPGERTTVEMCQTPYLMTTDRRRIGIFAIRGPRRPNPIGLHLVRLIRLRDDGFDFAGVDMIDGTPLLDIKPWVAPLDVPGRSTARRCPQRLVRQCRPHRRAHPQLARRRSERTVATTENADP